MSETKNVFISHHHKDDKSVTDFTNLLGGKNYNIRNSSIRINKEKNRERLEKKQIPQQTLERLLRMKMRWAGTVVVLIGSQTHSRKWVNWEIEQAAKLGKRIIGVFMQGGKDADMPENLEKFGDGVVGWNSNKIIDALEGKDVGWCNSDGAPRKPENNVIRIGCQ
ncbi:TIR domain-containing protein [Pedobacter riviphilus]|uniref:TIR domain-containing protein n=1 Tax=Pedobacter riviphilus TaxID=2766984 RepID=A0ABX6TK40_9SPHI|nr:TIR domain-containing protein [Pedobacter riviphilus]QNR85878.1 TIR domain-containing protein [Pedobacter riviphilus]